MTSNALDKADRKSLMRLTHALKPVITVAKDGLKDSVMHEIDLALNSHQLVKVKIVADREQRDTLAAEIINDHKCQLVHSMGQNITLYRRNIKKPSII